MKGFVIPALGKDHPSFRSGPLHLFLVSTQAAILEKAEIRADYNFLWSPSGMVSP